MAYEKDEKKVALDEDFLNWWAEGLEKQGYDLDQDTIRVATQQDRPFLFRDYNYNEYFAAMRQGEYWPLATYNLAYTMCLKSVMEGRVEGAGLPWKRSRG